MSEPIPDPLIPVEELPPITHRFTLGAELSDVEQSFLYHHGFLVFDQVATAEEVEMVLATQTLLQRPLKTYEVKVTGSLQPGALRDV